MNAKTRLLATLRELCDEIGPEDGAPPKRREGRSSNSIQDQRLAGRVARVVALALGAADDPALAALCVLGGRPDPDPRRIELRLCAPGVRDPAQIEALRARLDAASGLLRDAVAADLQRKRTPRLRFVVLPDEEVAP